MTAPEPVFSRRAQRDLRGIRRYVARDSGRARADELVDRILAICRLFATQPRAGRPHPDLGPEIRSCRSDAYLIFYRPGAGVIEIIRVLHGRRDIAVAWQEGNPSGAGH
jgi:toxin ParE1/3/4